MPKYGFNANENELSTCCQFYEESEHVQAQYFYLSIYNDIRGMITVIDLNSIL